MEQIKIIAAQLFMLVAVSCQQELTNSNSIDVLEGEHISISAYCGESKSKTVIQDDGSVWWNPCDSITVFYWKHNLGKFISLSDEAESTTVFVSEKTFVIGSFAGGEFKYWGVYPYNATNTCDGNAVSLCVPSVQTAVEGSFDPNAFPSMGCSFNQNLAFYNVCGGVKFSLVQSGIQTVTFSSNSGSAIAGKVSVSMDSEGHPAATVIDGSSSVTLNAPEGEMFVPGKWYYISLLPGELSSGFTMSFVNQEDDIANKYIPASVLVKRSVFGVLNEVDQDVVFVKNLSQKGTANSYIVTGAGNFMIKTVKGNSLESVGNVYSAEVLWESYGTDEKPEVGDLVSVVGYANGFITFRTSSKKGNAVIAAKDESGNILWSWHIWLTDQPEDQVYNNNAGVMMDRNLGATSVTPGDVRAFGLLYQWGRKDPFLGSAELSSSPATAASTITWPNVVRTSSTIGTIQYTIAHPTTYILNSGGNYDWYYTGNTTTDNTRWRTSQYEKGLYDPCPAGYRVPDGGEDGIWAKAFDATTSWSTLLNYNKTNEGMDFSKTDKQLGSSISIWYPAAGSLQWTNGAFYNVCYYGYYWSCSIFEPYYAYDFLFNRADYVYVAAKSYRTTGECVRCCRDTYE